MELFFPEISRTTFLSRLRTRSGRRALRNALPSHRGHLLVDSASRTYFQDHNHGVLPAELVDYPPVAYPYPEDMLHTFKLLYVEFLDRGKCLPQRVQHLDAPPPDVFGCPFEALGCPLGQDDLVQLWFRDSLPNLAPFLYFAARVISPASRDCYLVGFSRGDLGYEHLLNLLDVSSQSLDLSVEFGEFGSHSATSGLPPSIKLFTTEPGLLMNNVSTAANWEPRGLVGKAAIPAG